MNIARLLKLPFLFSNYCVSKLRFGSFGWNSIVIKPLHVDGGKNIYIGKNVIIQYKTWVASMPLTGCNEKGTPELVFEDGCVIGHFNHIYATNRVVLRRNVLTADKVYISDNIHGYEDIGIPILRQPIIQKNMVDIGEGSWLGENVCVIGASIGKQCIIGANSVVTRDIPDYCVVVGAPAKIIKRYDFDLKQWRKTDPQGNFMD